MTLTNSNTLATTNPLLAPYGRRVMEYATRAGSNRPTMLPTRSALYALTPADYAAAVATLDTASLIRLANERAIRPVKTRTSAIRCLAEGYAVVTSYGTSGGH